MNRNTIIFVVFFIATILSAQEKYFSLGTAIGLGQIKGRSPVITSYAGKIFIEAQTGLISKISFRLAFIYAQKFEKLIPEDRTGRYYPFIRSIQFFAVLQQSVSSDIFIKEGVGLITINDRTFSDVNQYEYGIGFFASPILDLRGNNFAGFTLQANLDFGIAFTGSTPLYYLITLGTEYYF